MQKCREDLGRHVSKAFVPSRSSKDLHFSVKHFAGEVRPVLALICVCVCVCVFVMWGTSQQVEFQHTHTHTHTHAHLNVPMAGQIQLHGILGQEQRQRCAVCCRDPPHIPLGVCRRTLHSQAGHGVRVQSRQQAQAKCGTVLVCALCVCVCACVCACVCVCALCVF